MGNIQTCQLQMIDSWGGGEIVFVVDGITIGS